MNIFCQKCGAKMVYSSEKPNFCQKCGAPMSSNVQAPAVNVEEEVIEPLVEDSVKSKIDISNINSLDVEITPVANKGLTFGQLYDQKPMGEASTKESQPSQPAKSKKEFLEEFKREAGTSRQ